MARTDRLAAGSGPAAEPFWSREAGDVLSELGSGDRGLTADEAGDRLVHHGPNSVTPSRGHPPLQLLARQFTSPIILILAGATALSMALGDLSDGAIILAIIVASGLLGFWQEHQAGQAVAALLDQVRVHVDVRRDGGEVEVPVEAVVPGDVVVLRAGDIIPADCRVLTTRDLSVDESALTGESFPADKAPAPVPGGAALAARSSALYFGTHVVSGTGTAVVVATGRATELGGVAAELEARGGSTRFERGITAFGLLLARAMAVLVSVIFVVNLVLHRPVVESFLFSLALAVGLTPQLLPAIVAVCLSTGARRMAAERVIVKRLDAIEDFGTMSVLCTDKTGTVTAGIAELGGWLDPDGRTDDEVLGLALLNAGLQRGFPNPLDAAILRAGPSPDADLLLDEVPYDFHRKRLSVLVAGPEPLLVTKGAFRNVLEVCDRVEHDGRTVALDDVRARVEERIAGLSAEGFRVIAVASRAVPGATAVSDDDERGLTLRGFLTFADGPKPGAARSIADLSRLGVSVRLVTGDNHLAARHVAAAVGLPVEHVLTGADIDALDDRGLAARVGEVAVFADVQPLHKERLVRALGATGETVGFLGDGINDAAALHAADVGISVDTAVDVAKQAAAIVLLDKSLDVVTDGVRLGRRTFANTMKYVRVTTSANFGNMLSMAVAAAFLPFLPLLPRQILLLNFLSDIPGTTIAADQVDPEQLDRPRSWDLRSIRRFMVVFGLVSSLFDLLTFAVLRWGFDAGASLFRSGWFVESTATELAVMLVLRTRRPFWRSRPGRALVLSSAVVAVVTVALPYSPLAGSLGLAGLSATLLLALAGLTVAYVTANEVVKHRMPLEA